MEQLLAFPSEVVDTMGWSSDMPISQWRGVQVNELQQVVSLNLTNSGLYTSTISSVGFPSTLISLNLENNFLGDIGATNLVLPSSLERLNLAFNGIGPVGASELSFPHSLKFLSLLYNHIGSDGAAAIRLPPNLIELDLSCNNICNEGATRLQLPSKIERLLLVGNGITSTGAHSLVLPPTITQLYIHQRVRNEFRLTQNAQTPEGRKRYCTVRRTYILKQCNPVWKEICRGFVYGQTPTVEPVFQFLQHHYGSRHFRECIIQYYNPYLFRRE